MSWWLTRAGVDHVVLERGVIAQSWRARRWDSLRLLTPNWMSRLPGYGYEGDDPDGYQRADEVVALLEGYGRGFGAPVRPHTTVVGVGGTGSGFVVDTDDGPWRCRAVVVATGTEGESKVPALARDLPGRLQQVTALGYRGPGQVAPGGVLVVGASASGVQIADELRRAGEGGDRRRRRPRPGAADLPRPRHAAGPRTRRRSGSPCRGTEAGECAVLRFPAARRATGRRRRRRSPRCWAPPSRSKRAIATRGGLEAPTACPAGDAADTVNAGSPVNPGIGHGEIVHAHYGSGVSFRDPDGIALEVFAPPA